MDSPLPPCAACAALGETLWSIESNYRIHARLKLESRITRCTDIEPNRSMAINLLDPGQGLAGGSQDGSRFRRRDNRRVWQS